MDANLNRMNTTTNHIADLEALVAQQELLVETRQDLTAKMETAVHRLDTQTAHREH